VLLQSRGLISDQTQAAVLVPNESEKKHAGFEPPGSSQGKNISVRL
jgi:hypothetical protein